MNKLNLAFSLTWRRYTRSGSRVFANSIPKAGTHLLSRCLKLLPGIVYSGYFINHIRNDQTEQSIASTQRVLKRLAAGTFVGAHMPYSHDGCLRLEEMRYKTILLVRDPRDLVVSQLMFLLKRPSNRLYPFFTSLKSDEDRLMAYIEGVPDNALPGVRGWPDVGTYIGSYWPWIQNGCHLVRFEDLVGERGGGDNGRQQRSVQALASSIGIALTDSECRILASQLFNPSSHTFRKGAIGDWRNHFNEDHKATFKAVAGQVLIDLGYETSLNW